MEVNILTPNADEMVIEIGGRLDTSAVHSLHEQLIPVMENLGKQVKIDFSNLEYISSSGLRVLLMINKKAKEKGGRVVITHMKENILQIFQIVGFDKIFIINPSDSE